MAARPYVEVPPSGGRGNNGDVNLYRFSSRWVAAAAGRIPCTACRDGVAQVTLPRGHLHPVRTARFANLIGNFAFL